MLNNCVCVCVCGCGCGCAGLGENATEMAEYSKENLDLYSFELSAAEMTYALLLRTAHFTMRRSIYRESATKSMRCVLRLTDCCD
jgi:hypothetical protein